MIQREPGALRSSQIQRGGSDAPLLSLTNPTISATRSPPCDAAQGRTLRFTERDRRGQLAGSLRVRQQRINRIHREHLELP